MSLNDSKWNPSQQDDTLYGGFAAGGDAGKAAGGGFTEPPSSHGMQAGNDWSAPAASAAPPPSGNNWGRAPGTQQGSVLKSMDARPMTSNRASGFQATTRLGTGAAPPGFDPFNQQSSSALSPSLPLQKRSDNSPEEQCLEAEKKVNALIEESAMLALHKDHALALQKAIEAGKRERWLCKEREKLGLAEQINIDLTYSVHFNLAVQYHNSQCYSEAINTYTLIVRNKQYAQSGRLRVNMGNIYYEQGKYTFALKMYKSALEVVPTTGKELRFKIQRNMANTYVRMGQYQDAINHYESIMKDAPDMQTGFNLLLSYYILRDKDRMKRQFVKLLQIKTNADNDDDDDEDDDEAAEGSPEKQVLADDGLLTDLRVRRKLHTQCILTAGRLIAPVVEADWEQGFAFIVTSLKQSRVSELKQPNSRLASELEMCCALQYLKHQQYGKAIDGLKAFEKKDRTLKARAACNLSYLCYLEGDYANGEQYADMSIDADKYNASALVNKGNFLFKKGEFDRSKQCFLEALSVEADCVEAIYNLGLATKALHQYEESLKVFKRLQTMIDSVEVTYQLGNIYDLLGRSDMAAEWLRKAPTDPAIFARLANIYVKEDDESQAFHYNLEAHRYLPVCMDVINWLGAYFVRNEVYEKAMKYFERAAQIEPKEVKWRLLVASCYRRIGAFPKAKQMYEEIHRAHPNNIECPRYLLHLCKEMGLTEEAVVYHKVLAKLERRTGATPVADEGGAALAMQPSHTGGTGDNTYAPVSQASGAPAPLNSRHAAQLAAVEAEKERDALQPEATPKRAKEDDDVSLDDEDLPGM